MCRVGSDDEIASVMGHEMADVLLKHNEKAQQNTAVGGLITGVIAASAGSCYTVQCTNARTDLLESGMQAGGAGPPGSQGDSKRSTGGRSDRRKEGYRRMAVQEDAQRK